MQMLDVAYILCALYFT